MGQGMQVSCTLHFKSNDNNNKTLLINKYNNRIIART